MRRAAATIALVLALAGCTLTAVLPDAPPTTPQLRQRRACARYTLIGQVRGPSVAARKQPARSAALIARFPRTNAQGAVQVFPVVEETYAGENVWYKAQLPIRPNDTAGWILADDLRLQRSDYRLQIDLSRLRLDVYRLCRRTATYAIGVGTKDTPTPRGTFFLNSLLRPPEPGSVYGAFAFGLSGYSNVIRDWAGGGIVGIHGTNDPSSVGRRVSHGCIRMRNTDIRALVRILPLGTPVVIL
jgi:lipoprotein-anchoring transpeptidase ErfK/SrfK